jgi:hypothetical protein
MNDATGNQVSSLRVVAARNEAGNAMSED